MNTVLFFMVFISQKKCHILSQSIKETFNCYGIFLQHVTYNKKTSDVMTSSFYVII